MNDFTLEELHSILEAFVYVEDDPAWRRIEGWDDKLKAKVQSMIDNYCEHEIMTADMKEHQVICTLNENGETYFTITSDVFAFGSYASLDAAHKIICGLAVGANHFDNE